MSRNTFIQWLCSIPKELWGMTTEYIWIERKYGECICPLSWSVHCNFVRDGKYSENGWASSPPPSSPAWANFSYLDGMYARKRPLPLCVYSVCLTTDFEVSMLNLTGPQMRAFRTFLSAARSPPVNGQKIFFIS
jgi:hypothetical protein